MYKQLIIARRDLRMSPRKLAIQVSHASMAFLIQAIRDGAIRSQQEVGFNKPYSYIATLDIDPELFKEWISGSLTKVVRSARDRDKLEEAAIAAEAMGWNEGVDYFIIRDKLEPTCIGFRPMDEKEIDIIGKRY